MPDTISIVRDDRLVISWPEAEQGEPMDKALIVRRWFEEVWNQGREQTIDELMAPDAVTHGLTDAAQTHRGPTAFKPFWAQLRGAFPDIHFTIDDVVSRATWWPLDGRPR